MTYLTSVWLRFVRFSRLTRKKKEAKMATQSLLYLLISCEVTQTLGSPMQMRLSGVIKRAIEGTGISWKQGSFFFFLVLELSFPSLSSIVHVTRGLLVFQNLISQVRLVKLLRLLFAILIVFASSYSVVIFCRFSSSFLLHHLDYFIALDFLPGLFLITSDFNH